MKALSAIVLAIVLAVVSTSMSTSVSANHGNVLHNATEQSSGNWYGSKATINWTNPNLRTGQWVYHRTSSNHQVTGSCFRYSEIGWRKTTSGLQGLIVWDSGCSRREQTFTVSAGTHTYSQQYFLSGGTDRYNWYIDGTSIGNGQTNFSYSTTVTCGGEVATGVEAMGNTKCSSNQKLKKNADGTYVFIPWNGHTNYVDDAPYTNTNDSADPNNSFFSKGNE